MKRFLLLLLAGLALPSTAQAERIKTTFEIYDDYNDFSGEYIDFGDYKNCNIGKEPFKNKIIWESNGKEIGKTYSIECLSNQELNRFKNGKITFKGKFESFPLNSEKLSTTKSNIKTFSKTKKFGKYSISNIDEDIEIDKDFLARTGEISYSIYINQIGTVNSEFIDISCHNKKIWSSEERVWKKENNKFKKKIINYVCKSKAKDPEIISLLEGNNWKKYPNDNWVNVNGWEEDNSTEYKDFDTKYYTPNDQEISAISVDCSSNNVAFVKEGEWTQYKKAKGVFKQILNDKCPEEPDKS